jgi:hypothetical protein
MLFEANHALEKEADYTKLPDGTWEVEVRALKLRVTGPTPTDRRFRLLVGFDKRLAGWILGISHRDRLLSRRSRRRYSRRIQREFDF